MQKADIQARVIKCVADALGMDEGKVQLSSSLVNDLGAESLDFLDIIFRVEKSFQISLSRDDLGMGLQEADDGGRLSEEELTRTLTAEERRRLIEKFPGIDPAQVKDEISVRDIPGLVTPATLAALVERKLQSVEQAVVEPAA